MVSRKPATSPVEHAELANHRYHSGTKIGVTAQALLLLLVVVVVLKQYTYLALLCVLMS